MPSSATRKTVSAPKKPVHVHTGWVAAAVVSAALCIVAVTARLGATPTGKLQAGGRIYTLETVRTPVQQALGLSKRTSMPANHGMLFVMPSEGPQCFWMKDMHFALDIIWVDINHKVTRIMPALSPATYPAQYCAAGKYVIELNAEQAAKAHIGLDQTLTF